MHVQHPHPLALWDAPFLPVPGAHGAPLREGRQLPLAVRRMLAAQIAAGVAFLLEQGFFPDRALLRQSHFVRGARGVWWRLSEFPRWSLDNERLSRALAFGGRSERLPWFVLRPFLAQLLPEMESFWAELGAFADPWSFPKLLLEQLVSKDRGRVLDHPLGWGRFLWARRFALPEEDKPFFLDEPEVAGRVSQALGIPAGSFDHEELARRQAQGVLSGDRGAVITTTPAPGVKALPLATPNPLWCLLPLGRQHEVANALAGASAGSAFGVRLALTHAVASAWKAKRREEGRGLLSYPAQKLASVLERAGVGVDEVEAAVLSGSTEALGELARFHLVVPRFQRWFWHRTEAALPEVLEPWCDRLPEGPLRWALQSLPGGFSSELASWCDQALDQGNGEAILGFAPWAQRLPELRPHVVEAALTTGWLAYAEPWLGDCGSLSPLFQVWWALAAGDTGRLPSGEVSSLWEDESLPPRLLPRGWLLLARLAERQGDFPRAQEFAGKVMAWPGSMAELRVEAAFLLGEGLSRAVEELGANPGALQKGYHLLGIQALRRGDYQAGETHLRRALQVASGRNPLLLGELLADAGAVAMLSDKPVEAEKRYAAAEFWLSLAGSRRASQLVTFNRAVLANDRLQWRKAQRLLDQVTTTSGEGSDLDEAFLSVEWARSLLVQGDVDRAAETIAKLEKRGKPFLEGLPLHVQQGLAAVKAHVALLRGDLQEVEHVSGLAEPSERRLFAAVLTSCQGTVPEGDLSPRWGLVLTARLLALARTSPSQAASLATSALAGRTLEGAVGVARALLLAPKWGAELMTPSRDLRGQLTDLLQQADLHHWVLALDSQWGRDWVVILGLLSALQERGHDLWRAPEWERLLRELGLSGLQVKAQGQDLLRVGLVTDGTTHTLGPFELRVSGVLDAEKLAVLGLALHAAPVPTGGRQPAGNLGLSGSSPQVVALRDDIARYAPLPVTVLVIGEPGTGKERVARALHHLSGRRGEFVAVNCAGIPDQLLEAELFGVVKGAFTGADRDRPGLVEQAESGTLFLDEIGELPPSMQAKLLRVLQEKEVRRVGATRPRKVDVRFVAATNRDLRQAVASGHFRRDLYDRLAMVTLRVPPLRERMEDIPHLVEELVAEFARQFGLPLVTVRPTLVARLQMHTWPGNVRELESVVVQTLVRCPRGTALGPEHLPPELANQPPLPAGGAIVPLAVAERAFYKDYFDRLLRETRGNRTQAAQKAGLSRQALTYRLRQLGLGKTERKN